jgi:tol-pal system protein YbgF
VRAVRLFALAVIFTSFSFGASKEMIELQRDVALLHDSVDAMQRDLDTKLGQLTAQVQQMSDSSARANSQLQDAVTNGVGKQLAPVVTLNSRVDQMSDDVRALKDALTDLGARLERMDAKMTDLKNQLQIIQNPPPAPGATTGAPGSTTPGGQAGPPAGMSADKTYQDARRDQQAGNLDLAYQEYQQYLQYFPNTELAANAQYYLGEIDYNRAAFDKAIQEFDAVLERYPQNPKTSDARWMKGMALVRTGQKSKAVEEFRALIHDDPGSDAARRAAAELRQLGTTTTARKKH